MFLIPIKKINFFNRNSQYLLKADQINNKEKLIKKKYYCFI
jgi:hypothetical protein